MERRGDDGGFAYDFDQTKVVEYRAVPPGTYLCRVDEARSGTTRSGHVRLGLKFVVHRGPHAGRIAAWDGLTFSPMAAARTKQMLEALGLPHEGKVHLRADDLLGRLVFVTVELGEYENPETGQVTRRNQVPYGGVTAAPDNALEDFGAAEPGSTGAEDEKGGADAEEATSQSEIPF